ncbi:MAG: OsmC family protein [Verrucomicrobia bacterium]|nr:OsmC family protein [Verrucomicrobiota bacterium]
MSVSISIGYLGELRCEAVHGPSGNVLQTDAPRDNHGKGEAFSPTDLVATALGTCMATTMALVARQHGVELAGTKVTVRKEMSAEPPRRIARLVADVTVPLPAAHELRERLEHAAHACPVARSLHPDTALPVTFVWQG